MADNPTPETDVPPAAEAPALPAITEDSGKALSLKSRNMWVGTAVGVGSAAVVAALLYANRKKPG